jgi:hypothetical protein
MPPNAAANTFRAPAEHVVLRKPYFAVDDLRTFLLFALAYFAAYGYGSLFSQTTSSPPVVSRFRSSLCPLADTAQEMVVLSAGCILDSSHTGTASTSPPLILVRRVHE